MILYDYHNGKIGEHFGIYKTLKRLKHNYHWYRMGRTLRNIFGHVIHVRKLSLVAIADIDS